MLRLFSTLVLMGAITSATAAPTDAKKSYAVSIEAPETAQVGQATSAKVKLEPGAGYKINKQYPIKLQVTPPGGVDVERTTQKAKDAVRLDEEQALFEVKFTAKEAGRKEMKAVFGFSVCTPKNCQVKKEKLSFSTEVR